jgi:GNAT superfamily N-acetyltransferase
MGPTEPLRLAPDRLPGCLALSAEAGWNQTEEDWALFFRHGRVFGFAGPDGAPAASGAVLPYPGPSYAAPGGAAFAWVSMVLVTAARRRERLGTRILEACVADLAREGAVPVLDATPAGEAVYRPMGFEPVLCLTRWQGTGGGEGGGETPRRRVRPLTADGMAAVAEADAAAFGADRGFLLRDLFRRAPRHAFASEDGRGFVLARPGRLATQLGPLVAPDEGTAADLLDAALAAARGPVFLDLADRWRGLGALLRARGFAAQRPFLRMALGRPAGFGEPGRLFAAAGPEFG